MIPTFLRGLSLLLLAGCAAPPPPPTPAPAFSTFVQHVWTGGTNPRALLETSGHRLQILHLAPGESGVPRDFSTAPRVAADDDEFLQPISAAAIHATPSDVKIAVCRVGSPMLRFDAKGNQTGSEMQPRACEAACFSLDGSQLLVAADGRLRMLNADDSGLRETRSLALAAEMRACVESIAPGPGKSAIVCGRFGLCTVQWYDDKDRQPEIAKATAEWVRNVSVDAAGARALVTFDDGTVKLFEIQVSRDGNALTVKQGGPLPSSNDPTRATPATAALLPDGRDALVPQPDGAGLRLVPLAAARR